MTIKIGEGEYEYTRPSLKKWLVLEDIHTSVNKAVDNHERDSIAQYMTSLVSTALLVPAPKIDERPWYEVVLAYFNISEANLPLNDVPILRTKVKEKVDVWDYDQRTWYVWSHLFAEEYGWTLDYIADLDVDDAIGLAQEIAIEDQLNKEWEWMLSEIPYQAKEGFKELPRPDWMRYSKKAPVIPKLKIRKDFMPVGNVIRYQTPESEGSIGTI